VNETTNNDFWNAAGHNTPGIYNITATITNTNANDCVGQVVSCGNITISPACENITNQSADKSMSPGTCYTYEGGSNNCGFRPANYGGGTIKVSLSGGGCNNSDYTVPSNNNTPACTRNGTITVTGVSGSGTIAFNCY
jgi:hypothetical protein